VERAKACLSDGYSDNDADELPPAGFRKYLEKDIMKRLPGRIEENIR
jgi:hypothetical protein